MASVAGASAKASHAFAFPMARFTLLKYTVRSRRNRTQGIQGQAPALKKREAMAKSRAKQLVVCIDNDGYPASLEKRKIYVALLDSEAEQHGLLRIVDESGEDYRCPKTLFRPIDLPIAVRRAVLAAA